MRTLVSDLLFDGDRLHRGPVAVDVEGSLITAVRPLAPDAPAPPDALDVRGDLLMPGLINAHVHLARGGAFGTTEPVSIPQIVSNLELTIAAGVTTIGELGSPPAMARALAALARRRPGEAPDVKAAGPLFTAPRGYPLDWVPRFVVRMGVVEPVSDAESAGRAVKRVAAAGMLYVRRRD